MKMGSIYIFLYSELHSFFLDGKSVGFLSVFWYLVKQHLSKMELQLQIFMVFETVFHVNFQ